MRVPFAHRRPGTPQVCYLDDTLAANGAPILTLHRLMGQQHVAGLQVAVPHRLGVQVGQSLQQLAHEHTHLSRGQLPPQAKQVSPVCPLHHQVRIDAGRHQLTAHEAKSSGRRGLGEGVMETDDIVMLQTAQDSHFPQHPFGLLRASQHIWDALDGHMLAGQHVQAAAHGGEGAAAQQLLHLIPCPHLPLVLANEICAGAISGRCPDAVGASHLGNERLAE
mmetsp:Transcript_20905/g.62920  ORF Transcript_20905/g.62920 Transcript_20905/m.62920 type:complete len:221 (+) Transcript_20905:2180-2842(+)